MKLTGKLILVLLLAGVAAGQLFRIPLFVISSASITLLDVAVGASLLLALAAITKERHLGVAWRRVWGSWTWRFFYLFITWALVALLLRFQTYTSSELLLAFSYWLRLFATVTLGALLWAGGLVRGTAFLRRAFWMAGTFLVVVGYLQLIFIPDFSFMAQYGWDPHIGRMLSTFFDPNFFGAMLALLLALAGQAWATSASSGKKWLWLLLGLLVWAALYFTFSRSAWLTGAIALPLALWRFNYKAALITLAVFVTVTLIPSRLSERFQAGFVNRGALTGQKVSGNVNQNGGTTDLSTAARILSFKKGVALWQESPLTGVGYNAYGPASVRSGLAERAVLESLAGGSSDSSLITILATTGAVGLFLFLAFLGSALRLLYRRWRSGLPDDMGVALFGFTIAWIAGSFFNNTLLYIFLLVPWLLLLGANPHDEADIT